MVAYRFEDSRGGESVERHLAGYKGLLQVDGWGAYNRLAEAKRAGGPLQLAACWAFWELHVAGMSHVASETVERMAALWAVEEEIRGQSPDVRRTARQQQSAAIVAEPQNSGRSGKRSWAGRRQGRRGPAAPRAPSHDWGDAEVGQGLGQIHCFRGSNESSLPTSDCSPQTHKSLISSILFDSDT